MPFTSNSTFSYVTPLFVNDVYREAFAGVVTMDKLRKEMKKSHIPGVLHFWDAIIKHLQSVVQVDEKSVEYLAK